MTIDRVQQAREEIRRCRALAEAAGLTADSAGWDPYGRDVWAVGSSLRGGDYPLHEVSDRWHDRDAVALAAFIAANDPEHVLAVLDAAEKVLERHQYDDGWCSRCGVPIDDDMTGCPDALAVLDLYAPEATS